MTLTNTSTKSLGFFFCNTVTDCGSLNITNGVVNYQPQGQDQTLMGATASYTCNSGYTLSGNGVRTCQASGVWTNSDPSCNRECCMGSGV